MEVYVHNKNKILLKACTLKSMEIMKYLLHILYKLHLYQNSLILNITYKLILRYEK